MDVSNAASTKHVPLRVHTPLQTTVTQEGRITKLQCVVTGHPEPQCIWYKNGEPFQQISRIRIICNERLHKLLITYVKKSDHGLYTIVCKNKYDTVISQAVLHVGSTIYKNEITRSYFVYPKQTNEIIKHLANVKVRVGDTIRLRVEFKYDVNDCIWCKNNEILFNKTDELRIENAKVKDSGVYAVVNISNEDITCSWAEVSVFEDGLNIDEVPRVLEPLPEVIEINKGEDIALICKVTLNDDVAVAWFKDGSSVRSERTMYENYGDNFIGLRIVDPRLCDSGEYSVTVQNVVTGHATTSSTFLAVLNTRKSGPISYPTQVIVTKALEPVVACIGSKVSLVCSFDLPNPLFYFVTWKVGLCEVERTNSSFHVITDGSRFILHIKQLEPDMGGKITCELRQSIPEQKYVVVATTSAYLTVIPEVIAVRLQEKGLWTSHVFDVDKTTVNYNHRDGSKQIHFHESNEINQSENFDNDFIVTYCRMDEDLHFLTATPPTAFKEVKIFNKNFGKENENDGDYNLIWSDEEEKKSWYEVDIEQASGMYAIVGVITCPSVDLQCPPLGRVFSLRVRKVSPVQQWTENTVCIVAAPPSLPEIEIPPQNRIIQDYSLFEERYNQTGYVLGQGGFGTVELITDKQGKVYAMKKIRTQDVLFKAAAVREYQAVIMLQHNRLVRYFEFYEHPRQFVICMEYLWGGELLQRIVEEDHFKEVDAVNYVKQILEGLAYMHGLNVAHLDLKPENIICVSPNSTQIKIIDFGLARRVVTERIIRSVAGTREYIAPEVANCDPVTITSDMWSLGVIVYVMLSGQLPGGGDARPLYLYNDVKSQLRLHMLDEPSQLAKDFILKCCEVDCTNRLTSEQGLREPWIVQGPPPELRDIPMRHTRERLRRYVAVHRVRWHMAGTVVRAVNRLRSHMAANFNSVGRNQRRGDSSLV